MACREWRERLSAYVDGEAAEEEAVRVREHLASCERCRELERRMRSLDGEVAGLRETVREGFRDAVFARLEAEKLLPPPKKAPVFRLRYVAVPLAAAAALAIVLWLPREAGHDRVIPGPSTAGVERSVPAPSTTGPPARRVLSPDEKEMIALLDVLEDPAAFDGRGGATEKDLELLAPSPDEGGPQGTQGPRRRGA